LTEIALSDPARPLRQPALSIDVVAPAGVGAIVAFGDSITDGAASTPETNGSWPSGLAARLLAATGRKTAVLNLGISGNRVLHDGAGVSALARFDTDVLAQPGVRTVIVLEGINDIGFPHLPPAVFGRGRGDDAFDAAAEDVSADEIIGGLRQLIERARIHGLKVIGGTLLPYEGAVYFSPDGEAKRLAVNAWIRSAERSTESSRSATPITRRGSWRLCRAAITFTPTTPVTRRWLTSLTSRCFRERLPIGRRAPRRNSSRPIQTTTVTSRTRRWGLFDHTICLKSTTGGGECPPVRESCKKSSPSLAG
jgi:lysophospholipase L1-like esterase